MNSSWAKTSFSPLAALGKMLRRMCSKWWTASESFLKVRILFFNSYMLSNQKSTHHGRKLPARWRRKKFTKTCWRFSRNCNLQPKNDRFEASNGRPRNLIGAHGILVVCHDLVQNGVQPHRHRGQRFARRIAG